MAFVSCFSLPAQTGGGADIPTLLQTLSQDVKSGNHRTLRDLISLSDEKGYQKEIRRILQQYTFFTTKEIDLRAATKEELMAFYYDNTSRIKYSEILNAFYITPVEQQKVDFEIKYHDEQQTNQNATLARRLMSDLNDQLDEGEYTEAQSTVHQIVELEVPDRELYLNLLRDPRIFDIPSTAQQDIYQSILTALEPLADMEIVEIGIQMAEGGFCDPAFTEAFLTNTTNNAPDLGYIFDDNLEYFSYLIDSLETFPDLRSHGYEKIFNFKVNFFQFPVDYYGKMLGRSESYSWIQHNALLDLQRSQHPRALFYIAANWYRNWKDNPESIDIDYLDLLKSITNVEIGVKDKSGKTIFEPSQDKTAMLNYFLYWASHYNDYEWDKNRQIYTNKLETLAKTQNYERLFRRLNSRNDTIALHSFVQLSEGDPLEIKSLAKKYRQLLRNQNKSLPELKYKYLEQLSQLTAYCRLNEISYKVDKKVAKFLGKLLKAETEQERFAIENELINLLKVQDLTAIEYWSCIKAKNEALTFSVGRILDWSYSKNWDKIISNRDLVRLYLKKSYLFEAIGISGNCNSYLNKFDIHDADQRALIESIGRIESDEDILHQISILIAQSEEKEKSYTEYNISEFLDDPLIFNKRDLKTLPKPTNKDVKEIVGLIRTEEDPEIIKKFFAYLWLHPDIEYIPELFNLIDDQRIVTQRSNLTVSVADNVIPIVENVYGQNFEPMSDQAFATQQWRALWKEDGANFDKWEQRFFEEKLDSLKYFDKLKISQLNALTESDYYSEDYKSSILEHLPKIKPLRNIRRLSIEPKLVVKTDLKYFENFVFTYKELDDIPKLFEVKDNDADIMLAFIEEKSATFDINEKGSFYNNLFRAPWLGQYISKGLMDQQMADAIKATLETYLTESEFMSEYEEQVTLLNIAQLQFMGRSVQEKIDGTLQLQIDKAAKAKVLKSIIATVSYEDIPLVADRFDPLLEILGANTYDFLSKDFGIPIFSFSTMKEQEEFVQLHDKLSEYDFYKHYLQAFGLEIFIGNDQLDFQKVYRILSFDNVSPFVGETGGKRDWYIYGIIKLLESHFDTRLGFHEKLNESQTFYSFSSTKRAIAWQEYLEEKGLVSPNITLPPSFNLVLEE